MRTLREARSPHTVQGRLRDHAVNAFHIFEKVIFVDKLKRHVRLRWDHLPGDITGATFKPDVISPDLPTITICLNADVLRNGSQDDIIASLLHQMIHAYFLAVCKHTKTKEGIDERLEHGKHFGAIMHEIKNAAAKAQNSRHALPLNFGQKVQYPLYDGWQGHPRGLQYGYDLVGLRDLDLDCSDCQTDIKNIEAADIDSWYSKTCEPAYKRETTVHCVAVDGALVGSPREMATPAEDWVEFIYDDKAVIFPRYQAERYDSLKKHFAGDKRELQIPAVPLDVFNMLCKFVIQRSYGPDISRVQEKDAKGPPIIRTYEKDSTKYLVSDIQMYKLGKAIGFDELSKTALKRLNEQHFTHNDPVAALKEIYDPETFYPSTVCKDKDKEGEKNGKKDPDPTLRTWALSFLKRHITPKPTHAFLTTSNLASLQAFKPDNDDDPSFAALCAAHDTLAKDVAKAQEYFAALGYAPLPLPKDVFSLAGLYGALPQVWPTAPGSVPRMAYPVPLQPQPQLQMHPQALATLSGRYAPPLQPHPQILAPGFVGAVDPGRWSEAFKDPMSGLWVRIRGGTGEAVAWDEGRGDYVPVRRVGGVEGVGGVGPWMFVDL
ncbi:hypothetical protein H2201_008497 [Coniosporium apollinis]|uniref:SprT-like domain-containing protein n=1 Tax=Coniosporium apollinis TaxID=61459 RepID=A0ABQ9NHZ7_9PEZI|nr:hypothetical protein H2201_008497 [Coniosporium apollinis]